jgi:uncharacterized protein YgiM (DUF1202 family)
MSMVRKLFILSAPVMLFLLLVACGAPAATVSAPEATASVIFATPNQSFSTPTIGSVTVLQLNGVKGIFLRSRPEHGSALAGEVQPGDSGQVQGIDSSGAWLLVTIRAQTGWIPVQLVDYTIAQ